jgi:hypothetical protein
MSTILEYVQQHADLERRICACEESLGLLRENFCTRDGLPAKNIALTSDGRPVPSEVFSELAEHIEELILNPWREERARIEEMKVP